MKKFILQHKELIKRYMLRITPLDQDFIKKHNSRIDWKYLSGNLNIDLDFDFLLDNLEKVEWEEFFPFYMKCFKGEGRDKKIEEFLDKCKDKINWKLISMHLGSFENQHRIISKYRNYWCWKQFTSSRHIKWDHELIRTFKENIDWDEITFQQNLDWSVEMIEEFEDQICWESFRIRLPGKWDSTKINKLRPLLETKGVNIDNLFAKAAREGEEKRISIDQILGNEPDAYLDFFNNLKKDTHFDDIYEIVSRHTDLKEINFYENIKWSEEAFSYILTCPGIDLLHLSTHSEFIDPYTVLKKHADILVWHEMKELFVPTEYDEEILDTVPQGICANTDIVWTDKMLDEFADRINWDVISESNIDWTPEIINKHFSKFNKEKVFKQHDFFRKVVLPELDYELMEKIITS